MSEWYSKNLGDPLLTSKALESIRCAFIAFVEKTDYEPATHPKALFYRHETHAHMHCELVLYIPPNCTAFALSIGARACVKPIAQDLAVSVGPSQALLRWFTP